MPSGAGVKLFQDIKDVNQGCSDMLPFEKLPSKCKIIVGKAVLRFGTGGKSSHRRRRHALVGF